MTAIALASAFTAITLSFGAHSAGAAVVPVYPGPAAAGKPITGTTINLPPLPTTPSTATYNAGAQFAEAITTYYSTQVVADQAGIANAARNWTVKWLDRACGGHMPPKVKACRAMAVFDVDETLLNNYTYYSAESPAFTYSSDTWGPYQDQCKPTAIAATAALLRSFVKMGMGVALVTGRHDTSRTTTLACLRKRGITGWTTLVMRNSNNSDLSASIYKAQARKQLQASGWKIGPSLGDQVSDMAGGYLRRGFLLPNPMYLIP